MAESREWVGTDGPVKLEHIVEDDGSGKRDVLRHVQDCTPVLDQNARLRQHQQHGTPHMGAKLVASVPLLHRYKLWPAEFQAIHGVHPDHPDLRHVPRDQHTAFRKGVKQAWDRFYLDKLNSREFSQFRIDSGRL